MLLPITRTAVADIRDYCNLAPRQVLYVEQANFHAIGETCFYAHINELPPTKSTVCVWRVYPKINGPEDGAYAD